LIASMLSIEPGWNPGAVAASHEVYFGADADAVENATKTSPEYKATKALGDESCDAGKLGLNTTYNWRIAKEVCTLAVGWISRRVVSSPVILPMSASTTGR